MLRYSAALVFLLAAHLATAAPGMDFHGGFYQTGFDLRGTAGDGSGNYGADLHDELGYDRVTQRGVYLDFAHELRKWPNVRLSYARYNQSVTTDLGEGNHGGLPRPPLTTASQLRIGSSDVIFYYSPLKHVLKLDLGFDLHRLDVDFALDVSLQGQPLQAIHKNTTQWFPAAWGSARMDLPLTGLYAATSVAASRFKQRELLEARLGVGWEPLPLLGVELGYNHQTLKFDSSAINISTRANGPYMALTWRF